MALDLPDALPGEVQAAADLLQRSGIGVVEAVAEDQDGALALAERSEGACERLAAERDLDLLVRRRVSAGDEVAEDGVLGLADRLVEARRRMRRRLHLARLLDRQGCLLGDLLQRRVPP